MGGDKVLRMSPMLGVGGDRLERGIAQNEWQFEYTVTGRAGSRAERNWGRSVALYRGNVALCCAKRRRRMGRCSECQRNRTRLQLVCCALVVRCVLISERKGMKGHPRHERDERESV